MKLDAESLGPDSLSALGVEAVDMLCRGDISRLAQRCGYALAYDRDLVTAIQDDLRQSLSTVGASSLAPGPMHSVPTVKYFPDDGHFLYAAVECLVPCENGASLQVSLVVTRSGAEKHITLEDISAFLEDPDSE